MPRPRRPPRSNRGSDRGSSRGSNRGSDSHRIPRRLLKLQPVNGFAAETAAASVLVFTAHAGLPVSTTQVITASIMGVGATRRLSRDDLLTASVNPSRDVAPAYRTTDIDLKDAKRISGIVVFESADGLIVQTGAAETRRVATEDIDSRTPSSKSLMPDGLLKGIKPEELADLFAFLAKQ